MHQTCPFTPSGAYNISPDGNAHNIGVVVKHWKVHLHILQLRLVIGSFNIVLRYVDWQAQCGNLIQLALNFLSTPYTWRVQTVGLHAYRVDVTRVNRRADKIHNGVSRSEEHTSELQSRGQLVCR